MDSNHDLLPSDVSGRIILISNQIPTVWVWENKEDASH